MPVGIANIFSMPELEKKYRITFYSREKYCSVYTKHGEVRFYNDEQGLLFTDLTKSSMNAATVLVQTVYKNYEW